MAMYLEGDKNMFQFEPDKNYLIVVSGRPNSGKSSILSNIDGRAPGVTSVYQRFIDDGAQIVRKFKKRARIDIVVAMEYKGKKIGISASGDCVNCLKWIEELEKEGCQYIITANSIHSNGDTCAYINDFAKKNDFQLISLYKFPYQNDFSNLEEFIFKLF